MLDPNCQLSSVLIGVWWFREGACRPAKGHPELMIWH